MELNIEAQRWRK